MIISTFDWEKRFWEDGYDWVVGIDEAGRGPLAGPVVAGAAVLKSECHPELPARPAGGVSGSQNKDEMLKQVQYDSKWHLVRDSKTLSFGQREKIFDFVLENFHVGIGICDHRTIDRMNILEASFLAMKKAVASLNLKLKVNNEKQQLKTINHKLKTIILIDGNRKIPNFSLEQKAVVSGDKIVKSISAASIVAKVTRDRMMLEFHKKYPEFGFDRHKGYGTKFHLERLMDHGPCDIHRRSFAPVGKLAKKESTEV